MKKDNDILENFEPYEDKKSTLKEQDIEENHGDLVNKSSDTRSHARDGLLRHIPQDRLFANELSLFLKDVRFSKQEFCISKPLLDIKYYHSSFQNNNFFYSFNN